jgi:hypothetical protein
MEIFRPLIEAIRHRRVRQSARVTVWIHPFILSLERDLPHIRPPEPKTSQLQGGISGA